MGRQSLPDICDTCGKEIPKDQKQYIAELFEGKSSFTDKRSRAQTKLYICHTCFLNFCKNGYEPNFISEMRNPQWVQGSKLAAEKYYVVVPEIDPQTKVDES